MEKTLNVLFLCTANSARSIMAEGALNAMGKDRFRAFSAGSHPGGKVNPFALETLARAGYDLPDARSKSWDEFAAPGAPHMDIIITVCDNAAGEVCPFWPGHPATAHWGYPDPAAVEGSDEEKRAAFWKVFEQIRFRIQMLINLPTDKLDKLALGAELKVIGSHQP